MPTKPHDLEVFFDGDCPLCAREIRLLRRLDKEHRIRFLDISAPDFDPRMVGLSHGELMAQLHARLADGTLIRGVEVFRQLYAAVGFKRMVAMSRWGGLRQALDFGYEKFAKNRLRLTGRCDTGSCSIDSPAPRATS